MVAQSISYGVTGTVPGSGRCWIRIRGGRGRLSGISADAGHDPEGQILCDPVLLKPYDDVIWLSHGDVDLTLWARGIALAGGYDVRVCEKDSGIMVIGPNVNRAVEKGVTDTAYYSNSDQNPYEAGHGRLVNLDKGDFVGRDALKRVAEEGPKRKTVGLFIEGDLPLLEWYWPVEAGGQAIGEVRWAAHSFALERSIGIAVVDQGVEMGSIILVDHPLGKVSAEVTTIPFVPN